MRFQLLNPFLLMNWRSASSSRSDHSDCLTHSPPRAFNREGLAGRRTTLLFFFPIQDESSPCEAISQQTRWTSIRTGGNPFFKISHEPSLRPPDPHPCPSERMRGTLLPQATKWPNDKTKNVNLRANEMSVIRACRKTGAMKFNICY